MYSSSRDAEADLSLRLCSQAMSRRSQLQNADVLMGNSQFNDALIELQSWVQATTASLGPEVHTLGDGLMALGACQMRLGLREQGEASFTRAEVCFRKTPDPVLRDEMLFSLKKVITDFVVDLDSYRQSMLELLAMLEQQGDAGGVAECKRALGIRLASVEAYEEALPLLEQALEYQRKAGKVSFFGDNGYLARWLAENFCM